MILVLLTLSIGINKKTINENDAKEIISLIKILPTNIQSILNDYDLYKKIAKNLYKSDSALFIGRNIDYALAMEGSLKLKEVSYINSQCYPAGELKHGTISLIDDKMPVIAIVTDEKIAEKTISNIKECKSRGAIVTLVITEDLDLKDKFYDYKIVIPKTEKILQSLLTIVPLQILSYEVAKYRKCDIDQPKNLAKSVTVE